MNRPWTPLGIGWVLALIVLILAVLCALGSIALSPYWLLVLLALAILL